MIRLLASLFFVSGITLFGSFSVTEDEKVADENQRKQLWLQVEQAEQKSLPKSAIESLQKIYDSALTDQDFPEAIRALAKKYFLEGNINQPMIPFVIRKLSAEMDGLPADVQPVMKTILANWFYTYYQQNRWRFAQRSQTGQPPSEDFETWDLPRLLGQIDTLFTAALESAEQLKTIPIAQYDELILKGNVSDEHRPTLFDFIAFQALDFYSLDEQVIRQQGAFDLRADGPIFSPVDQFLAWEIETPDDDSFLVHAVKLYQDLLQFHQDDENRTASLDADLHRLQFGYVAAVGSEKDARYKSTLQQFIDSHGDHPLAATALASLASVLQGENELVKAHALASQGYARHADSPGGRQCYNLIQQIEARELNASTERVWNSAGPMIDVTYRNIDKIHFRLIEFDYQNWRWGERNRPENLAQEERDSILRRKPIAEWSNDLPKTADYRQRLQRLPVKLDAKPGCYLLLASQRADFSEQDNVVSVAEVWVSDLAVVVRNEQGSANVSGQVMHAITGNPIAGANVSVSAWVQDGRNSKSVKVQEVTTDESGIFQVPGRQQYQHLIYVRHEGQSFGLVDTNYKYRYVDPKGTNRQTIFFTDRSLYRPGQTVQFKGICLTSNRATNQYSTIANQNLTVVLKDVNNQEVERRAFRCNEFGSFSGSFTAPRDRATGQMRLEVEGRPPGSSWFRVEEYKRPKFLVEVPKPEQEFRLNERVKVNGKAVAYTGAAIDGAKVAWRVVRQVRYPEWWMWRCWYCPPTTGQSQEIAHGVTETAVDGSFNIDFEALPDLSVDRASEPVFTFTIHADVTDSAGETRSASQSIRIGYTSLQASLVCDNWQTADKPVSIELTASTLDGTGQETTGSLKIHRLVGPDQVQRAELQNNRQLYWGMSAGIEKPEPDLSKINAWPLGEVVEDAEITTAGDGMATRQFDLPVGAYKAVYGTTDTAGQKVNAEIPFLVVDLTSDKFDIRIPQHFEAEKWSVEPGEQFVALWGTGYEQGRAYIELEHRGKVFQSYWTDPKQTQHVIRQDISEKIRGGFVVRATYVRDNRAYLETRMVSVPWTNKKLQVKWEHFTSKLQPGGRESWSAVISGPDAKRAAAEMVATMYDASLDAFAAHNWPAVFRVFYQDSSRMTLQFQNAQRGLQTFVYGWSIDSKDGSVLYRHFPGDVSPGIFTDWRQRGRGVVFGGGRGGGREEEAMSFFAAPMSRAAGQSIRSDSDVDAHEKVGSMRDENSGVTMFSGAVETRLNVQNAPAAIDLSQVTARNNLNETAFFFPHLTVDDSGVVRIEFEVPEALTQWKFLGFAHDTDLRSALLMDKVVTSKDLMVQPNPPRFLREGDVLEFSVKVLNQSATRQNGSVRLTFADARTNDSMDAQLAIENADQAFDIPAGQSQSLYWKLQVPDFVGVLIYKAVAATDRLSDGEEGFLPVLSRRILVTESLPLPIRGKQTREFTFERLKNAGDSDTLQSQSLTLQMTSNPAWYAVMALPYLMEFPHQCSEQVFNRLYANALGQHIVSSDPKIERIFEQWRGTDALDSPLEKNEELRNVLIAESPWLRAAKKESQARRDVGILFDENRLNDEVGRALNKLKEMQYGDGAWPWFPGGRANDFITLYITTGFGRLRHLGVNVDVSPAIKSLDRLDNWIHETYQEILRRKDQELNHLTPTICLYLYGRSFFLKDQAVDDKYRAAIDYFLGQSKKFWTDLGNRQSQGHLAIGLKRFGDLNTPQEIMASLTERSISDDEMGMLWRESPSWWWYEAPIETQVVMIEAYDEVMGDAQKVEDCKVWLLKQKQTQNWKTTKATADACYALLLRGTNLLASDELVQVQLGSIEIEPTGVEAGTGFFEQRFVRGEIKPEMGQVTVTKKDDGIAWGGLHWQYLEDISKIKPYEGTPLTLKKGLFIKRNTEKGPVIEPVTGPIEVGDELVTRVELRVDRDMEYVHLKDYRGSGTEPVNVLSQYKFQDGLSYYESTKDTASHFFIDYLRRGTYVFEYSVRVQHRGHYQTGIAELQCMYAPEFNSHSGSVAIDVR